MKLTKESQCHSTATPYFKVLPVTTSTRKYYFSALQSTTRTAQGSGGSFKNSKPIREAGCCESRMAEQGH